MKPVFARIADASCWNGEELPVKRPRKSPPMHERQAQCFQATSTDDRISTASPTVR